MLVRLLSALPFDVQGRIEALLPQEGIVLQRLAPDHLAEGIAGGDFDLLVTSRASLPAKPEGLIRSVRSLPERPDLIVLTRREDATERAALLAAGCMAVLGFDLPDLVLRETLDALLRRRQEEAAARLRVSELAEDPEDLSDFISESPTMQVFLGQVWRVVHADTSLLILGETGVGKERLARAVCAEGPRSRGPFLAVNCAALPETLLESELFGHEEGAFTGATRSRRGYFELAHGGSLLLDEIGEMPHHLQVKLLRVLDERRIQRVGGERSIPVNVRVIAATNRDLESEVAARRFRADLFYRLAVVTLEVPPLRERPEDIPHLANRYLERFRNQTGRNVERIEPAAMLALRSHDWPGNVRELINTIERAVLLCHGPEITLGDLPERLSGPAAGVVDETADSVGQAVRRLPPQVWDQELSRSRQELLASFEQQYLSRLLASHGGRVGDTARAAGISTRLLYSLMKRHGLRKERFKTGVVRRGRTALP